MNITDFEIYKDLLKEQSGLVLGHEKIYLIESRLSPIARKWGFDNLDAMTWALKGVPDYRLVYDIVQAMTTNETSFFRDTRPFELFTDFVLPEAMKKCAARKKIRIWCAAASSGQEPYSIAMLLKERSAQLAGWNIEIIGTDISREILAQASEGSYTQFEVQRGLPIQMLVKYFKQVDKKWNINDDVKKMVKYQYFNLLEPMTSLGIFDIVFCRNVLIYFDDADKKQILERMARQMTDDAILFLGGAETVLGITDALKPVTDKRGLYAKPDNPLTKK